MSKDWTGNGNSIYKTLGASNHTEEEREINDFYATERKATEVLLEIEKFSPVVWENAVGAGDIAKVLVEHGYAVRASDIVNRGYPDTEIIDFLTYDKPITTDVVSNPPYKIAAAFVEHCLDLAKEGTKVAMFLKLQFLEGKERKNFFKKYPPKIVYVSSSRLKCAKNGDFDKVKSSAVAFAWYIWEKGYCGDPIIKWVN